MRAVTTFFSILMVAVLTASCSSGGSGSANTYSISGTVSGLSGTGLVLQNNNADDLTITADGAFNFATAIADASSYSVSVNTQPGSPSQSCGITNGTGTIASADVINISVNCANSSIVNSVSPSEARVGDTITVSGQDFGIAQGSSTLNISGVVATNIVSWSNTEIMATIPAGAGTGDVTVAINGVDGTAGQLIVPWVAENPDNVAISVENSYQQGQVSVSDGNGGAIIAWSDKRNGTDYDVYAQRVNSAGVVQWTTNGVAINTATGDQLSVNLTTDGNGGAIIAWADARTSYDIYAQRINSDGVVQWATNGVVVCNAPNSQFGVTMLTDGNGGAFIGWKDGRHDSGSTFIQRINSAGVAQWANNGVAIAAQSSIQDSPLLTSDGSGGALLVWHDGRGGAAGIYGQRVNSAGVAQWAAHGVPIVTGNGGQETAQITSDGSGGAIITWQDSRNGVQYTDEDIYAQRINSAGVVQWTADGIAISTATDRQYSPQLASDDNGGAIIVWNDYRSGNSKNYAQRINSAGTEQWTANGVAISTTANSPRSHRLISDGNGGAIITWSDLRNDVGDVYAQGITGSGLQ